MKLVVSVSTAAMACFFLAAPAAAQETINLDQERSISGRIERTDPVQADAAFEGMEGQIHYDDYRVRLAAHQRVRLTVRSEELDPVVTVYRAANLEEAIAENDDDGEGLNSRLTLAAPEEGVYVVRVRSFGGDSFGPYTLAATPLPPLPAPMALDRGRRTRTSWNAVEGALTGEDPDVDGQHFDDYRISLRAGDELLVRVDSEAFDPMVQILTAADREGMPIEGDDDTGPGVNALLGFTPDEAGEYVIRVTSFGSGGTGRYRLRVGR
jgi:hypothetical protein